MMLRAKGYGRWYIHICIYWEGDKHSLIEDCYPFSLLLSRLCCEATASHYRPFTAPPLSVSLSLPLCVPPVDLSFTFSHSLTILPSPSPPPLSFVSSLSLSFPLSLPLSICLMISPLLPASLYLSLSLSFSPHLSLSLIHTKHTSKTLEGLDMREVTKSCSSCE